MESRGLGEVSGKEVGSPVMEESSVRERSGETESILSLKKLYLRCAFQIHSLNKLEFC